MIFCNGFLQRSSPNHKIPNALKIHLWKHLWQKLQYIHQISTLKKVKITYAKNLNKKITCDGGKNCWQYFSSCFFFNETTILFLLNTHVECCISPLKMSQSVKYFRKMLIWWIFFFPFSVVGMYLPICIYVPTCLSIYLIRLYFRYRTFSDSFSIYFTSLPNQFPGKNCIQLETY